MIRSFGFFCSCVFLLACAPPSPQGTPSTAPRASVEQEAPGVPSAPAEPQVDSPAGPEGEAEASGERYAVIGVLLHDTLQLREEPGTSGNVVGGLAPTADDIELLGEPVEVAGSRWVKVRHGERTGWVNRRYLAKRVGSAPEPLRRRAHETLALLLAGEFPRLAALVHPKKGVRFSPHGFIDPEALRVSASDLSHWTSSKETCTWGAEDGTGEPIVLTFAEYHQKFVVDRDYLRADELAVSPLPQRGNEYNNIEEVFPGSWAAEYYVEPRDHGLDWRSLRLVFEPVGDVWYLVAVLHVTWTI